MKKVRIKMFRLLKSSIKKIGKREEKKDLPMKETKIDDLLWDLELALLQADVAYPIIEKMKSKVKDNLRGNKIARGDAPEKIKEILKETLMEILSQGRFDFYEKVNEKRPFVIMFVGVNGSGKTTTIAKLAWNLKQRGKQCVVGACDTFRAGAMEQLADHSEKVGLKMIKHRQGGDPAAVAYDTIEHAKARGVDVVLLDTAGRMHTNTNLMDEMKKIKRVAKPDMILFVGDALTGNDAIEQAEEFNKTVGIDGVILAKMDADAKGGSALSIAYTTKKPLLFVGTGQKYEDLSPFSPEWMVERIFEK
jgi:fused signal recognition particle receptor